ncbi:16659_t:CDS:2 [Gigaspora margarita]|uniref:16659_t:CDS:1 n=1 Tax=Gigaspora margarita TaxID=4874 RepID=A0ABN7USZ2_GIGMA|nr:16659_t:CDS:2 [Gigaspora margarita]
MAQEIFNNLNNDQKAETKIIRFCTNEGQPSISNYTLCIYACHLNFGELKGSNLLKIIFEFELSLNLLESIDISKNHKLNRIVICDEDWIASSSFILLVNKPQINRIITSSYKRTGDDRTIADLNRQIQQTITLSQFQELSNLRQENKGLELKHFNSYVREQIDDFEKITTTAKNKANDNLKTILDFFLQTNKQMIESEMRAISLLLKKDN